MSRYLDMTIQYFSGLWVELLRNVRGKTRKVGIFPHVTHVAHASRRTQIRSRLDVRFRPPPQIAARCAFATVQSLRTCYVATCMTHAQMRRECARNFTHELASLFSTRVLNSNCFSSSLLVCVQSKAASCSASLSSPCSLPSRPPSWRRRCRLR